MSGSFPYILLKWYNSKIGIDHQNFIFKKIKTFKPYI